MSRTTVPRPVNTGDIEVSSRTSSRPGAVPPCLATGKWQAGGGGPVAREAGGCVSIMSAEVRIILRFYVRLTPGNSRQLP